MPATFSTQTEIDRFKQDHPHAGLSDHSIFRLLKQDNPNLRWDDTGEVPGTVSPKRRSRRANTSPTYIALRKFHHASKPCHQTLLGLS